MHLFVVWDNKTAPWSFVWMFGVFLILELMTRDLQGSTGENYIPQDAMFLRDSFQTTCETYNTAASE